MNFSQKQTYSLLNKMGYSGPEDPKMMEAFMASNPRAAATMGKFDRVLKKKAGMAAGGYVPAGFDAEAYLKANPDVANSSFASNPFEHYQLHGRSEGRAIAPKPTDFNAQAYLQSNPDVAQSQYKDNPLEHFQLYGRTEGRSGGATPKPTPQPVQQPTTKYTVYGQEYDNYATALAAAKHQLSYLGTGSELNQKAAELVQEKRVGGVQVAPGLAPLGAAGGPQGLVSSAVPASMQAGPGTLIDPSVGQAAPIRKATSTTAQTTTAEAPEPVEAATVSAQEVTDKIAEAIENVEPVTADPSKEATVKGQLELLMEDFEGGQTPPWASGAMRNAMALMQRRGLGASSMAGQAIVQAAMESALPIAMADAQTTAQFEMQNLNNQQQTLIFKTQQRISGILSDQAAINAAEQFNAASENQTNQFFANLESTVARFNADQVNAIAQFNAKEKNAVKMFNSQLQAQRDQFNATNSLIVAQANAKWRQDINTLNTAAQNESIMETAKQVNRLTEAGLNNMWQKERDLMSFAFNASENAQERNLTALLADKELEAVRDRIDADNDRMFGAGLASLATDLFSWGG
jgi:hypothetical protein